MEGGSGGRNLQIERILVHSKLRRLVRGVSNHLLFWPTWDLLDKNITDSMVSDVDFFWYFWKAFTKQLFLIYSISCLHE